MRETTLDILQMARQSRKVRTFLFVLFTVGLVGWYTAIYYQPYKSDPGVFGLFIKLFLLAPFILHLRLVEMFGPNHILGALVVAPYGALAATALSVRYGIEADMLEYATESANSAAIIFLLPIFLFIIRHPNDDQRSKNTSNDSENIVEEVATSGDFKATMIACCCYYSLVCLTAITSSAIVHHGILDSDPMLNFLTLLAWCSFISCIPFALFRSLHADQWALSSFLFILAAAVLMDGLDYYSEDGLIADLPCVFAMWIGLMLIAAIERLKRAFLVADEHQRKGEPTVRDASPERKSPVAVLEALRKELDGSSGSENNEQVLAKLSVALNELEYPTGAKVFEQREEEFHRMACLTESDSNSDHDDLEDSQETIKLSTVFNDSIRLQKKLDDLSDRLTQLENPKKEKRIHKFSRNNLRDTRRSIKK